MQFPTVTPRQMTPRVLLCNACAIAALFLLQACSSAPVISYHQVGACNGYPKADGAGATSAGPNQAYVVFQVETVDNSRVGSDFHFNPNLFYILQNGKHVHADSNLSFVSDVLGPFAAVPETVPPHQVTGINGYLVVVVQTTNPDGETEANNTSYFLQCDSALLSKTNVSQKSWPKTANCRDMILK